MKNTHVCGFICICERPRFTHLLWASCLFESFTTCRCTFEPSRPIAWHLQYTCHIDPSNTWNREKIKIMSLLAGMLAVSWLLKARLVPKLGKFYEGRCGKLQTIALKEGDFVFKSGGVVVCYCLQCPRDSCFFRALL